MAELREQNHNGGNGNGNGNTWKWVISGLAAALMAFAFYVLNINWSIATQYSSKQDTAAHQTEDDRRFDMVRENLDKQITDTAIKFRIHDQEMRSMLDSIAALQARQLLLEGRQTDVREMLSDLRNGQVSINNALIEIKQSIGEHLREERLRRSGALFILPPDFLMNETRKEIDLRFYYSAVEPPSVLIEMPKNLFTHSSQPPPPVVPIAVYHGTR